ncbi:MAG: hypothetical protein ACLRFE_00155 [Clostridia bacterium]
MAVRKFVKLDSEKGYLDNKDDINYYISTLMRKVAFGKMLGDFDENGLYVINQKIVNELIKMPKVVVEVIEDSDLIRSKVKADSFFHFILSIEDNKAVFKLLEKIPYQSNRDFNVGVYSNINEYVLDEMIVTDKDFNRNALYEKYNISVENNGEVLSIFDMDELSIALYYNIVEKLKVNYLVQNELILKEKELESVEADYFESMLNVLAEFKEFGDKVVTSVKEDLAQKHSFVIISKPFFQKTVNEIVDSYIDFHIQDLSPELKEQVLNRIREIKAEYYQRFKALLPVQIGNKAGVRFDANQILQEGIIGGLAQEISTKGFTSSDVRKILIDEDELQLPIAKIKEIVNENEEICKRDNARAVDITKGREKTAKFYADLEKESKVELLKPDTTLIKSKIDERVEVKKEPVKQQKQENKENVTVVTAPKVTSKETKKQNNNSSGRIANGGTNGKKQEQKKQEQSTIKTVNNTNSGQSNNQVSGSRIVITGTFGSNSNNVDKDKSQRLRDSVVKSVENQNVRVNAPQVDDGFKL